MIENNISIQKVIDLNIDKYDSSNGTKFGKNNALYEGYRDLFEIYSKYGAGITEFNPSLGMNPMKKLKGNAWSDEHFYVTWHPGPRGHRLYAEIIAYHYLDSVYNVLNDIGSDLNMTIARPMLEMLDLLQDPPYEYKSIAGNPQPINNMDGGQASIDTKYCYIGNRDSSSLVISIKIIGNDYLLIEKPYGSPDPRKQNQNRDTKSSNESNSVDIICVFFWLYEVYRNAPVLTSLIKEVCTELYHYNCKLIMMFL